MRRGPSGFTAAATPTNTASQPRTRQRRALSEERDAPTRASSRPSIEQNPSPGRCGRAILPQTRAQRAGGGDEGWTVANGWSEGRDRDSVAAEGPRPELASSHALAWHTLRPSHRDEPRELAIAKPGTTQHEAADTMARPAMRRQRAGEGCWLDASVQTHGAKDGACDNGKVG
jgi:hypothetical protein